MRPAGNPEALRCLGLPASAIGENLWRLIPEAEPLVKGTPGPRQRTASLALSDGQRRLFGYTTVGVALPHGNAAITLFRDIGPIWQAEKRRRRAEQLAHVGEMAARLSHDMKNPLASILAGLQILEKESSALAVGHRPVVDGVVQEVRRLSSIIGELLDAAKLPRLQPTLVPLDALIQDAVKPILSTASSRAIEVEWNPQTTTQALVVVDPTLLRRALGNLLFNALEAMPKGGRG